MSTEPQNADSDAAAEAQSGSLVPLYGTAGIVHGIQRCRGGDIILHTIRGEAEGVLGRVGRPARGGGGGGSALTRHPAPGPPPGDGTAEAEEAT